MSERAPDHDAPDDEDRAAILERRRSFVAAAMAGLATAATAAIACSPEPCLEPAYTGMVTDASSERVRADATPVPTDASTDAPSGDATATDAANDAAGDAPPPPADAGDGGG